MKWTLLVMLVGLGLVSLGCADLGDSTVASGQPPEAVTAVELSAPDGNVVGGLIDQVILDESNRFVPGIVTQLTGFNERTQNTVSLIQFSEDVTEEQRRSILDRAMELGVEVALVGPRDFWPYCSGQPDCLRVEESFPS